MKCKADKNSTKKGKTKGELEPESHLLSILAMEEFSKACDLSLGKSGMPQVNVPSAPVYLLS